jgi:hypothetical protein
LDGMDMFWLVSCVSLACTCMLRAAWWKARERHGRTVIQARSRRVVLGSTREWVATSRQDIRHSDERMRQLSTARRLVSMVENMGRE